MDKVQRKPKGGREKNRERGRETKKTKDLTAKCSRRHLETPEEIAKQPQIGAHKRLRGNPEVENHIPQQKPSSPPTPTNSLPSPIDFVNKRRRKDQKNENGERGRDGQRDQREQGRRGSSGGGGEEPLPPQTAAATARFWLG